MRITKFEFAQLRFGGWLGIYCVKGL